MITTQQLFVVLSQNSFFYLFILFSLYKNLAQQSETSFGGGADYGKFPNPRNFKKSAILCLMIKW
jgi:hypothetical protein